MPSNKNLLCLLGAIGICLSSSAASAQTTSPWMMAQTQNGYPPNQNSPFSSPTVSPYLNLGETPSGVSNYQSLVRPLIDGQDALSRQTATIQRLQRQLRDSREAKLGGGPPSAGNKPGVGSAGRFMYYSHYFGPQRER